MDMYGAEPPVWKNAEEAKQTVVQETLFQAFNPFAQVASAEASVKTKRTVVTYTVREGDTLSEIAQQYGISLRQLIEDNHIANPHFVGIGMKLVLRRDEVDHVVGQGETLDQIAERYQVSKKAIIKRNPLLEMLPDFLYVGQRLHIPIPVTRSPLAGNAELRKQMAQVASRNSIRSHVMDWPVEGATITSGFGMRWGKMHKGLDLWNEKKGNTPILAAKAGTVVKAGANNGGYGYMVILDHGAGLTTYYAHLRRILVTEGQEVERGEMIGYMGRTGDSTDYHLHFEVRQDDLPVNPLRYLNR